VTSWKKIQALEGGRNKADYFRFGIVRAREVGESYISAARKSITAGIECLNLLWKYKPNLVSFDDLLVLYLHFTS